MLTFQDTWGSEDSICVEGPVPLRVDNHNNHHCLNVKNKRLYSHAKSNHRSSSTCFESSEHAGKFSNTRWCAINSRYEGPGHRRPLMWHDTLSDCTFSSCSAARLFGPPPPSACERVRTLNSYFDSGRVASAELRVRWGFCNLLFISQHGSCWQKNQRLLLSNTWNNILQLKHALGFMRL